MKSTNWRKLAPTLVFLLGTLAAVLIRGRDEPEFLKLTVLVLVPTMLFFWVAYWVIEIRQRAKSGRTWQVMEQRHPGEIKYLFPVHARTRVDLDRLGLPTRPASLTLPMIGVVFGADVTFWEEGKVGWSLRIEYSNIEAIELASSENGTRNWPAICLSLIDQGLASNQEAATNQVSQRGDLVLPLQHRGHKKLSKAERASLVQELNSRLVRVRSV